MENKIIVGFSFLCFFATILFLIKRCTKDFNKDEQYIVVSESIEHKYLLYGIGKDRFQKSLDYRRDFSCNIFMYKQIVPGDTFVKNKFENIFYILQKDSVKFFNTDSFGEIVSWKYVTR